MGLFPGSKKYFREHSGAFSPTLWGERKPDVIVTDMMLILYMFDAFCQYSQGRGARAPCTLRSLAGFLWDKIAHPDGCEALERWQTHVVTFDVGGRSPRAKEATQDLRRSRVGAAAELAPFAGDDPDAPLPSPFSAFLRTKGALNMVVEAVVPLLEREFFKCMRTNCSIVVQCASGPILLRRDGLRISREPLTHVSGVSEIGEGDMSACFWVQYFNAQTTLVISKDTDMLLLLGLVCPSGPKKLFLRLDYKSTTDYVDMLAFKQWMGARFGSYYDGFLYVTMQGNDYVNKVSKGCGTESMLDALAAARRSQQAAPTVVTCENGKYRADEDLMMRMIRTACVRGGLAPHAPASVRQSWWYLFYALTAVNGQTAGIRACTAEIDGVSVFGWKTGEDGRVVATNDLTRPPGFSIVC